MNLECLSLNPEFLSNIPTYHLGKMKLFVLCNALIIKPHQKSLSIGSLHYTQSHF